VINARSGYSCAEATLKDNILFGAPYDEARYKKGEYGVALLANVVDMLGTVLHQCALERDLTLFEAGDKTEVGEKGLTLR
jgi:hypothetical protein